MKKYLSFFRLRFSMGLQYRTAAYAGVVTQFFWGAMEILMFRAFYEANASAFPMSFAATTNYVWLQQAFLSFFACWMMDRDIFEIITSGNIAYELIRPIRIYDMWFVKSIANRLSRAVLRCFPILIVAAFLPAPYGLTAPHDIWHFLLFVLALLLGLSVTVALTMLIYAISFFTISPDGLQILFTSTVELFAGAIIPLPFFPEPIERVLELLPFASMQNVPLRIYSGSMNGAEMLQAVLLQVFWLVVLVGVGKLLCAVAEKRVTIQGG